MNKKSIHAIFCCLIFTTVWMSCQRKSESNSSPIATDSMTMETRQSFQRTTPFDFLPTSASTQIVRHKGYILSYSEANEQAEWVAYELKKSELNYNNNDYKRPFFIADPLVKTGSADWKNYRRSGYDKGHLCPAGDRKYNKQLFEETFYTSNISPQRHDFNEGVWNRLEQKVRYWAVKYDGIYVVTGGVLEKNLSTIGDEEVSVPKYFYKVLLDNDKGKNKMIAFLVPHRDSDRPLYEFVVSVDQIERMTGIDFFPKLADKEEVQLEKNSDYKNWSFQ